MQGVQTVFAKERGGRGCQISQLPAKPHPASTLPPLKNHSTRHAVGATNREQTAAQLTYSLPTCNGDISEGCTTHHRQVCTEEAQAPSHRQVRNSRNSACLSTIRKGRRDGARSRTTTFDDGLQKGSHQEEVLRQPV